MEYSFAFVFGFVVALSIGFASAKSAKIQCEQTNRVKECISTYIPATLTNDEASQ